MANKIQLPLTEIPYSHKSSQDYAMMRSFIKDFIVELKKTFIIHVEIPKESDPSALLRK